MDFRIVLEIILGLISLIITYVIFALIGRFISKKLKIANEEQIFLWYHHLNAWTTFAFLFWLSVILFIAYLIGYFILK